jgi:hypothetical protein
MRSVVLRIAYIATMHKTAALILCGALVRTGTRGLSAALRAWWRSAMVEKRRVASVQLGSLVALGGAVHGHA